jgi:transmembrane sensor
MDQTDEQKKWWEIIASKLTNSSNEIENNLFNTWYLSSEENKSIYDTAKKIWKASNNLKQYEEIDAESAWQKINDEIKIEKQKNAFRRMQLKKVGLRVLKYAAIAIITFGITWLFLSKPDPTIQNLPLKTSNHQIIVKRGNKSQVILADGSRIWINSESKISYSSDFNVNNRTIYLEGEAYFDVAKNEKIPFIVKTSELTVKAVGTAFNIKCYPEEGTIETTLIRGSIKVESTKNSQEIILKPNEKALFVKKEGSLNLLKNDSLQKLIKPIPLTKQVLVVKKEKDVSSVVAWKDDKLVFNNESLESLSIKLERWYGVKILITDENLKQYHFSGILQNETINDVLRIIKLTLPIYYKIDHKDIIISKLKK